MPLTLWECLVSGMLTNGHSREVGKHVLDLCMVFPEHCKMTVVEIFSRLQVACRQQLCLRCLCLPQSTSSCNSQFETRIALSRFLPPFQAERRMLASVIWPLRSSARDPVSKAPLPANPQLPFQLENVGAKEKANVPRLAVR
jgi:hypothetical protein